MSAISSDYSSGATVAAGADAYSSLTSGDFMKIIFTELSKQDPLAPSDTKDLLNQISTIRSIQSDIELGDRLSAMAKQNEITSSSSLVGKFVTGKTAAGADTAGYVDSVSITRDGPILNLSSNTRVPLKSLTEVIDSELLKNATNPDNTAPKVAEAITDQVANRGSAWSFTVPRATFSDDSFDSLTFSATLEDGAELPSWLSFNKQTRTFTGTPGPDDGSPIKVKVTAIDPSNERASSTFLLTLASSGGGNP